MKGSTLASRSGGSFTMSDQERVRQKLSSPFSIASVRNGGKGSTMAPACSKLRAASCTAAATGGSREGGGTLRGRKEPPRNPGWVVCPGPPPRASPPGGGGGGWGGAEPTAVGAVRGGLGVPRPAFFPLMVTGPPWGARGGAPRR